MSETYYCDNIIKRTKRQCTNPAKFDTKCGRHVKKHPCEKCRKSTPIALEFCDKCTPKFICDGIIKKTNKKCTNKAIYKTKCGIHMKKHSCEKCGKKTSYLIEICSECENKENVSQLSKVTSLSDKITEFYSNLVRVPYIPETKVDNEEKEKTCKQCKEIKNASEFSPNAHYKISQVQIVISARLYRDIKLYVMI